MNERVPDHSSLSRMRSRLDEEVYDEVFRLVLGIVESKGLLRGKVAGADSTYLRADASMKTIVRKDTGDDYTTYLKKLCEEQGIESPSVRGRAPNKSEARRQEDIEHRVAITDGSRCSDRPLKGRSYAAWIQGGARCRSRDGSGPVGRALRCRRTGYALKPSLETARENMTVARDESKADSSDDDDNDAPPSFDAPSNEGREKIEVVTDKGYHA